MGRIHARFLIVFTSVCFSALSVYAQSEPQRIFELEGGVASPVAVPADVIAILKSDRVVDGCFKTEGAGVQESAWFEASEFDLNGDGRRDLIIKPKHPCLYGANQGPFWIFQSVSDGYQKVLAANGLKLTILPRKTNSFSAIEVSKVVGMNGQSTQFRFSRGKYQPVK